MKKIILSAAISSICFTSFGGHATNNNKDVFHTPNKKNTASRQDIEDFLKESESKLPIPSRYAKDKKKDSVIFKGAPSDSIGHIRKIVDGKNSDSGLLNGTPARLVREFNKVAKEGNYTPTTNKVRVHAIRKDYVRQMLRSLQTKERLMKIESDKNKKNEEAIKKSKKIEAENKSLEQKVDSLVKQFHDLAVGRSNLRDQEKNLKKQIQELKKDSENTQKMLQITGEQYEELLDQKEQQLEDVLKKMEEKDQERQELSTKFTQEEAKSQKTQALLQKLLEAAETLDEKKSQDDSVNKDLFGQKNDESTKKGNDDSEDLETLLRSQIKKSDL